MKTLQAYGLAVLFLFTIDLTWIHLNKDRYSSLVRTVQGASMTGNKWAAMVAYVLMMAGLVLVVLPDALKEAKTKGKLLAALRHGALFGLIVYGVFNATNVAMFRNYDLTTALLDTIWGTFAYFATTFAVLFFADQRLW